jgi:hypothetical protein
MPRRGTRASNKAKECPVPEGEEADVELPLFHKNYFPFHTWVCDKIAEDERSEARKKQSTPPLPRKSDRAYDATDTRRQ